MLSKGDLETKFEGWAQKFLSLCKTEMTHELSAMYLNLSIIDKLGKYPPVSDKIKEDIAFRIITSRAGSMKLTLSLPLILFMVILFKTPREVTMYLSVLKFSVPDERTKINMNQFSKVFPMGFPSQEDLGMLWDEQKIEGRNMLDMLVF